MKTIADSVHTALTIILLCSLLVSFPGCRKYDSVSPKAYEIAKALYSTCNRKDEERLSKVQELITAGVAESELTDTEGEWLLAIVEKAQSADWDSAMQDARTMMSEQIQE